MNKPLEFEIRGFKQVLAGLQKISGKSFETVLKSEAGMILGGASGNTPKAKKPAIVRHNMPEGYELGGYKGKKTVVRRFGKNYHVGRPVLDYIGPFGGKNYKLPYTYWMGKRKWNDYVAEATRKTEQKMDMRGLAASQFGFMADLLGITGIPKRKRPAYLQTEKLRKQVMPFIRPRRQGRGFQFSIILEGKGLRITSRTNAGGRLFRQAKARVSAYRKAVRNEWIKDIKKFMPKNYPLLFK